MTPPTHHRNLPVLLIAKTRQYIINQQYGFRLLVGGVMTPPYNVLLYIEVKPYGRKQT